MFELNNAETEAGASNRCETCAVEIGTAEIGPAKIGTGEIGTGEIGTGEIASCHGDEATAQVGVAAVVTASDCVAAGTTQDISGPLAADILGVHYGAVPVIAVADDAPSITSVLRDLCSAGARVIVVTGGTGIGPRDVTPEAIRALGGRELPGIGEAIRAASRAAVPRADLSRTLAVATDRAIVLGVPGSPGGVRDALTVALPLFDHALEMLDGSGHPQRAHHSQSTGQEYRNPVSFDPQGPLRSPPITAAECEMAVAHRGAGAVVSFSGTVRDQDAGQAVTALFYEAHPRAAAVLAQIVAEAKARPQILGAAVLHRVGQVDVGELACVAAVSARHRAEAFATCMWIVDQVKARAPIWKRQHFSDGGSRWVNSP